MPEFERSIIPEGTYKNKNVGKIYPKFVFVSDRERAERISSYKINPDEIVESKGMFNALDGTTHSSEAVADLASERFLLGRKGDLSVVSSKGSCFKGTDWNDYETEAEARVASERYEEHLARKSGESF